MVDMMHYNYFGLGISRCGYSRGFNFRSNPLGKSIFLCIRHGIPLSCGIGVVNATMPIEHATRAYLCPSRLKCFAERHIVVNFSHTNSTFLCSTFLRCF